jgi:hypothetical protein
VLIAAALVILASACGSEGSPSAEISPASPAPVVSAATTPADQLATYLQQMQPLLRRMKAALALRKWPQFGNQPDHSWAVAAPRIANRAMTFDTIAVIAATIPPPPSLRKAHGKLVGASRGRSAVFNDVADNLMRRAPMGTWVSSWQRRAHTAWAQFDDWWFAVRVEARKLGVRCPQDWRKLPGFAVVAIPSPAATASSPAATAPDPFVGKWSGTDNYGQGPFTMEIRKLGDGRYVQIGAGGQRTVLALSGGVLIGKVHLGAQGDVGGHVRIERAAAETLKAFITADAGSGLDDFANIVTFERKSD